MDLYMFVIRIILALDVIRRDCSHGSAAGKDTTILYVMELNVVKMYNHHQ